MKSYLKTNLLTVSEKQFAFEVRCRNFKVKSNQKSRYEDDMRCLLCLKDDSYEDEHHVFFICSILHEGNDANTQIKLDQLFGDLEVQIKEIKYFKQIADKRTHLLELRNIKF